MTEPYPIRCGKNPKSFLYSAHNIIENQGFVQVFPDKDAELLIDFTTDRMKTALAKVQEYGGLPSNYTFDELSNLVEYIGDVVYETFGQYNIEYLRIGDKFSKNTDFAIVSRARYNEIYGEDDGEILRISDIESGTFLCPEFAAVTGVLCHYAGLNAYIVRSPVALGTQDKYTSPSVYAGHSTVILTDQHENILCLVESSTLSRYLERSYLWQTTIAPLVSLTLQDLLNGQPFVGCSYYTFVILMMGDPIGLSETDYFTHSQYEGIDRSVRREAVERLYKYYQPYVNQIMKDSPYYLIKRWLDLDEGVGQQLCESHLDVGIFQQSRRAYQRNGYWVAEWLMLRLAMQEMDGLISTLSDYFKSESGVS